MTGLERAVLALMVLVGVALFLIQIVHIRRVNIDARNREE